MSEMPRNPTTTALLSRLQVFEPTRRPTFQERSIDTSWGKALVKGKLGQGQADLLELILYLAQESETGPNGRKQLLVDQYELRKGLGGSQEGSGEQLKNFLTDLQNAEVELSPNGRNATVGGKLIHAVVDSAKTIPALGRFTSAGQKRGVRPLKVVVLGDLLTELLQSDVKFYYDPHPIVGWNKGVAQAMVRHVKTHKAPPRGGWKLETLLDSVGAGQEKDASNRRRELKESKENLAGLGISISNSRVLLEKTPGFKG